MTLPTAAGGEDTFPPQGNDTERCHEQRHTNTLLGRKGGRSDYGTSVTGLPSLPTLAQRRPAELHIRARDGALARCVWNDPLRPGVVSSMLSCDGFPG